MKNKSVLSKKYLEHVQQSLRGLQDLHVSSFRFLDRLVVLITRLSFSHEGLVDLLEPVGTKYDAFAIDVFDGATMKY